MVGLLNIEQHHTDLMTLVMSIGCRSGTTRRARLVQLSMRFRIHTPVVARKEIAPKHSVNRNTLKLDLKQPPLCPALVILFPSIFRLSLWDLQPMAKKGRRNVVIISWV